VLVQEFLLYQFESILEFLQGEQNRVITEIRFGMVREFFLQKFPIFHAHGCFECAWFAMKSTGLFGFDEVAFQHFLGNPYVVWEGNYHVWLWTKNPGDFQKMKLPFGLWHIIFKEPLAGNLGCKRLMGWKVHAQCISYTSRLREDHFSLSLSLSLSFISSIVMLVS